MIHDDLQGHEDKLDAVIYQDEELGIQLRFTVSEFMGRHYLGIREYYLDFEGEWLPTKNGLSFPYNLDSVTRLYSAFASIMAQAEVSQEVIENHHKHTTQDEDE
ncbi:transcriptional coactivator p15 [Vibrio phage vB_ValS_X1]|uniref:Transcriptional coactivator p15 n=1 Tax=Vibrio phage vB_ValS_X1 TaxID=2736341 RepID=A0A6M9Z7I1_9CAUD|nr:transcriptional coactivator p15 [Vibrio phage vB_ValS_X1]